MITWDFYSKRKKLSLRKFLNEVKSYEEAVVYFKEREISPPKNLKSLYAEMVSKEGTEDVQAKSLPKKTQAKPVETKKQSSTQAASRKKAPPKKRTPRRKAAPKKEEPVQEVAQEQTVETKDEKKQYFRKIIKPEKK